MKRLLTQVLATGNDAAVSACLIGAKHYRYAIFTTFGVRIHGSPFDEEGVRMACPPRIWQTCGKSVRGFGSFLAIANSNKSQDSR